jgi:hypothetical protein
MSNTWTYKDSTWSEGNGLVGYDVEATDGSIGTIDEATTDTDRAHVVVDTGFWIFDKKRLVPAGTVVDVDHDAKKVTINLSKDQIKAAPDYDPSVSEKEMWDRHDAYYGSYSW